MTTNITIINIVSIIGILLMITGILKAIMAAAHGMKNKPLNGR